MAELEENLRITPEERLAKHDKKRAEWLEFEAFIEKLQRGWKFIRLNHGNTR